MQLDRSTKIFLFAATLLVVGFVINHLYRLPKFKSGDTALPFKAQLIDGSSFDLKSLQGQYVLLDFWGSWCGPCRKESPHLVSLYKDFHNKTFKDATGFEIVSIAIERKETRWRKAIQDDGLNWKYHIGQMNRFSDELPVLYGVREIPTKYLLDTNGTIIMVNPAFDAIRDFLNAKVVTD